MGTDIHGVLQVRGEDGLWLDLSEGFDDRNYRAFGVLADVRNDHGFAGISLGGPVPVIAEPRGFPDDFRMEMVKDDEGNEFEAHPINNANFRLSDWHEEMRQKNEKLREQGKQFWNYYDELGSFKQMGDHSFSYITAGDLETIDWQSMVESHGLVSLKEFKELKPNQRPDSYSGDVWGPGIVKFDAKNYVPGLELGYDEDKVFIRTYWTRTVADTVGERFMAFVRQMQDLGKSYGRDNVRFVFGFDS